jgi:UDP-arabinose 4-epimerase
LTPEAWTPSAKPVILTGGAGYVGSHVAKHLFRNGYLPVVLDNLSRGHSEAVRWGPLEVGDISEKSWVREILEKYRPIAVLHFAAFAYVGESTSNPAAYYRNNVIGSLSLLEAMRESGVQNLVFSSTCATFGIPKDLPITEDSPQYPSNPYGWTKLAVERMISDFSTAYGLRAMVLRYFNAAGADPEGDLGEWHDPETHLIPLVLQAASGLRPSVSIFGSDYPTVDGTCVRDYIHVADLAKAHHLALEYLQAGHPGDCFNLGTGRGYSVRQIVDAAEKVCGREIASRLEPRREGDPPALISSSEKARTVLGWVPTYSDIETILETAWKWQKARTENGGWPGRNVVQRDSYGH